ncbi:MAG: DNA polymerase III subunit alpha [Candidatus Sungbacteria bacterium]|nr:DNA polymerase III subunit alpha [Candidatus Sungbacteria bacterium]
MAKFTHLHVHSHYSLLDGLAKIDELIKRAGDLGFDALALTDHGVMYGAVEFYQKARRAGIKPLLGCELYIAAEKMTDKRPGIDDKRFHLTVLAKNYEGYKNLIQLVTHAHLEGFYYKPRVDKNLLRKHHDGIIALSGCLNAEIPKAILSRRLEHAATLVGEYQEIFGRENFYLELGAHASIPEQKIVNEALIELGKKLGAKVIGTNDVHYAHREDSEAQDILVSVQTGHRFDDEDRLTMKADDFSMKSTQDMAEFFAGAAEAMDNTQEITERVSIEIPMGKSLLPPFPVAGSFTKESYLEKLARDNLAKRYDISADDASDPQAKKVLERLAYELEVIKQTGFASYFLIVQDFVNWAKANGIVVGPGRGSAAGSIVSYVLGITNVDPLKYNLLFERFLNPERISMPDIDLDFSDRRRDEVIEYVGKKYGRSHVAQIITFGTMAARAAIRDTGRALGMPYNFCDMLAKMIPFHMGLADSLEKVQEFKQIYETQAEAKRLIDRAIKLEGVARHASTHACGVVIAPTKLTDYVPLQLATRSGAKTSNGEEANSKVVVTQYEMHAIEDLGLLKMDFLGLRNLTIIEDAISLIKQNHGVAIDIDKIPLDDIAAFKIFREGKTNGVFQFESSGIKRYLKELKPTELEDLIAMVSLYRPGPMELIPSFIARKHGREKIEYLHPRLEPILAPTYGIGVYQEQMMQITRDLAGFSLPEADTMSKAIGKKIKSLLEDQNERVVSGMIKNGIPAKTAQAIWELFPPFARYGFNRAHAVCYALIAYQTAYLKAHFPAEFVASLMTAEGFEVERVAFLVEEARSLGITILPPSINTSNATFTPLQNVQPAGTNSRSSLIKRGADSSAKPAVNSVTGFTVVSRPTSSTPIEIGLGEARPATSGAAPKEIRFGLGSVKNAGTNVIQAIIDERTRNGVFKSVEDFIERVQSKDLNKKSLESLVKCGALDELGERNLFLKNMDRLLEYARDVQKQKAMGQSSLFSGLGGAPQFSLRLEACPPADKKERLSWEKELLGLYISEHPLESYRRALEGKVIPVAALGEKSKNSLVSVGGLVAGINRIITKSGSPMLFVQLEDFTGRTEVLVFPRLLEQNAGIWQTDKILMIKGRISRDRDEPKILADEVIEVV